MGTYDVKTPSTQLCFIKVDAISGLPRCFNNCVTGYFKAI